MHQNFLGKAGFLGFTPFALRLATRDVESRMSSLVLVFAEEVALSRLDDDCKLLQSLLDETLKIEVGEELFAKVRGRPLSAIERRIIFLG